MDNANTQRIFIRWETNTRARIFFSQAFRIVKIVGLNFGGGSGSLPQQYTDLLTLLTSGNAGEIVSLNGTGDAFEVAKLSGSLEAAAPASYANRPIHRTWIPGPIQVQAARPNNSQGKVGQLVWSTTESKLYRRLTATSTSSSSNTEWPEWTMGGGGLDEAAVDARIHSDDNLAVPGSDTPGVVQVASVGDARARQPHDRGVVNVEGMDAALSGIPTGTQLSAAATDFHRKLGVEHTAGEIEYHGGFTKAWELTITDRPNRTGTFAGDTDGLTLTGGNIRGETAKQYGIWGFRAAGPLVTLNATLVQWTDTDSAGSNVGRIWISTNSAGRLLIHNPSDPTQSTLVASADRTSGFRFSTQDSLGFASQIAVEVLKLNPDDPTDDGIEFLPTVYSGRRHSHAVQQHRIHFGLGEVQHPARSPV